MNTIQSLNKVELRGMIGSTRKSLIGDKVAVTFSIATNYIFKNINKEVIIETTWNTCKAYENDRVKKETLEALEKGKVVQLVGRLINSRFIGADGVERTNTEIMVKSLEILEGTIQAEN